ncbi:MAG: sialate O-acetylesterase [Terrimicrobiaceae bacterium]
MKIFLLAGQSNMQGFGKIAGYPALRDIRIFNLATGRAEVAVEPLHHWHEHPCMPEGIGLGLAMTFALDVLKVFPNEQIGFIPSARGGSCLDEWLPGKDNFERAMGLYDRAVRENPEAGIAGILWHQGEADSAQKETAETYGERFHATVAGFRERFGVPDLPVLAGELGRFLSLNSYFSEHATVVEQTLKVIGSLNNAGLVSSEGLECDGGHTHFDTESVRLFGSRYAEAYLALSGINDGQLSAKHN